MHTTFDLPKVIYLAATAPVQKPPQGHACNRCGYCCAVQPCRLAEEYLGCTTGPCVALEQEDGRTWCGLVRHPATYLLKIDAPAGVTGALSSHLASMLGLGMGCDSADPID